MIQEKSGGCKVVGRMINTTTRLNVFIFSAIHTAPLDKELICLPPVFIVFLSATTLENTS